MFKTLTPLVLMTLLIMGCTSLPSIPVGLSPQAEASGTESSPIPTVRIQSSGSSVQGLEIGMDQWVDANGLGGGGGGSPIANPPAFPGVLDVRAGQNIDIVATPNSLVPVLIVTELTLLGVPTFSTVLKPMTNVTPYFPNATGHFVLQVTVQQSWQQYVTYIFEVNVTS